MNTISKNYFPLILSIIMEQEKTHSSDLLLIHHIKYGSSNRENIIYLQPSVISQDINDIMNGNYFKTKAHLRVLPSTFIKIVELIPNKHHGWSCEDEVICFLYWMACGCSYRVAAGFMGFSRYSVRNIIHKMLDQFIKMCHLICYSPAASYESIGRKFCRKAKSAAFKKFIGAIDGTHVRIKCPVDKHDEYINHKKFYSIQVQAVTDSNLQFTDVFVGFPGSVHDTRVFVNSPLYAKGSYPPEGYFLFGFKEPLTPQQPRFNSAHSRGRIVVEQCFGILKSRWRNIFNRDLELNIKNCIKTIFSAFILHNICVLQEDFDPFAYPVEEEQEFLTDNDGIVVDSSEGLQARQIIYADFLSEQNS